MIAPDDPRIRRISGRGTYVLHLELQSDRQLVIGKLGIHRFGAGSYAYVGRAFGPGGLAARLAHHLRRTTRPHWHLDYLRPHALVPEIWYGHTAPRAEHLWAQALMQLRGTAVPADGFGSSDCRCRSHLVKFARRPGKAAFRRRLRRIAADAMPPVRRIRAAASA